MVIRISLVVLLLLGFWGFFCAPALPQGGCTSYHTYENSGGAGSGPEGSTPVSSDWLQLVAQSQANAGGIGPTCTYTWYENYPDNGYGHWYGDCYGTGHRCPSPPTTAAASGESCPTCNQSNTIPTASQPINLATGNVFIQQNDIAIAGLGGGLKLTRTWNSMWPATQSALISGLFGNNWRSTYEERIFLGGDGTIKYARADGSFWSLSYFQTNTIPLGFHVIAPANAEATLTQQGATTWTITFPNGEQRVFDYNSGSLTAIVDRIGNTTQLAYDALNRLVSVTDPAGRHLYFSYANDSSYLITSATSDVGISLSYLYDNRSRLIQVTKPDSTTISFQYNANSNITAVLDSNGKVLESHTYDSSGRGLTSSRANGVDAVTVSYGAH